MMRQTLRQTLLTVGPFPRKMLCLLNYRNRLLLHHQFDTFAISYGKSGRVWLQSLLAKMMMLHYGIQQDVYYPAMAVRIGIKDAPRIMSSHDFSECPLTVSETRQMQNFKRYIKKRVILLVRDPRDVIVSYYFHRTRRLNENYTLSEFIRHPWWGIERTIAFMKDWDANKSVPEKFILIRYEDMRHDAHTELSKLAQFIGLDVHDDHIQQAVEYGNFKNMKRILSKSLAEKNPDDPESAHIRKGKVGGYVDYLSPDDINYIEDCMRRELPASFGYNVES